MPRSFQIFGESQVRLRFGLHLSGRFPIPTSVSPGPSLSGRPEFHCSSELGLAQGPITIIPYVFHKGVLVDDWGPRAEADVNVEMSHFVIKMDLIHFNKPVLEQALGESFGGIIDAQVKGAGTPLGKGINLYGSGCNYVGVNILPASRTLYNEDRDRGLTNEQALALVGSGGYWFPSCYMPDRPYEYPIGTERSVVSVTWKSIPYAHQYSRLRQSGEVINSGLFVWSRSIDPNVWAPFDDVL